MAAGWLALTFRSAEQKGVLTPDEFVKAGDELVHKCRTWAWAPGKEGLIKPYLPKDKQFLITRNVPSLKRATDYALNDAKEEMVEDDEKEGGLGGGWLSTHAADDSKSLAGEFEAIDLNAGETAGASPDTKAPDATSAKPAAAATTASGSGDGDDEDDESDIPDMDDFEDDNLVDEDPGALLTDNVVEGGAADAKSGAAGSNPGAGAAGADGVIRVTEPEDNIIRTRTYDLSITYDKYYRTPRIFLFGYDKDRQPLTPKQIMEDISADHANKTVTVDPHPHLEVVHASIHPCKHAPVMKRICARMEDENIRRIVAAKTRGTTATDAKEAPPAKAKAKKKAPKLTKEEEERAKIKVEQYLFIFLKFISSVIPTIEYDYTF